MVTVRETYIVDTKGRKKQVILTVKDYLKIQDELEELNEIRAFDNAMINFDRENLVSFEQVMSEIKVKNNGI